MLFRKSIAMQNFDLAVIWVRLAGYTAVIRMSHLGNTVIYTEKHSTLEKKLLKY